MFILPVCVFFSSVYYEMPPPHQCCLILSFLLCHTILKSSSVQQFPTLHSEIEQNTIFLQERTTTTAPRQIDLRLWSTEFCMADIETVLRIALSLAHWSTSLMPAIRPAITRQWNVCGAISCVVLGTLKSLSQTDKLSALWLLR